MIQCFVVDVSRWVRHEPTALAMQWPTMPIKLQQLADWPPRSAGMFLVFVALVVGLRLWAYDSNLLLAAAKALGPRAVAGARALNDTIQASAGASDDAMVRAANQFFNLRVAFVDDTVVWGQDDYWATPLETLNKGSGDCEDYAIAKYLMLQAMGVRADKLRLVYARARLDGAGGRSVPHMVLAYYPTAGAEPLILDNLIPELRPASARPDLTPVFSFNTESLWQAAGAERVAADPLARLSRWRDVLAKSRAEGF